MKETRGGFIAIFSLSFSLPSFFQFALYSTLFLSRSPFELYRVKRAPSVFPLRARSFSLPPLSTSSTPSWRLTLLPREDAIFSSPLFFPSARKKKREGEREREIGSSVFVLLRPHTAVHALFPLLPLRDPSLSRSLSPGLLISFLLFSLLARVYPSRGGSTPAPRALLRSLPRHYRRTSRAHTYILLSLSFSPLGYFFSKLVLQRTPGLLSPSFPLPPRAFYFTLSRFFFFPLRLSFLPVCEGEGRSRGNCNFHHFSPRARARRREERKERWMYGQRKREREMVRPGEVLAKGYERRGEPRELSYINVEDEDFSSVSPAILRQFVCLCVLLCVCECLTGCWKFAEVLLKEWFFFCKCAGKETRVWNVSRKMMIRYYLYEILNVGRRRIVGMFFFCYRDSV